MKKIMFNDQYGLTQAVLDGRKTQSRRIAYQKPFKRYCNCGFCLEGKDKGKLFINDGNEIVAKSHYKKGEVLAVAQRYIDILPSPSFKQLWEELPGWKNKMFVRSCLMPHQIKITNIRCERLQSISTEDCMKEGIVCCHKPGFKDAFTYDATDKSDVEKLWFNSPINAYMFLCIKLNLQWEVNPLVFVYDFELVK